MYPEEVFIDGETTGTYEYLVDLSDYTYTEPGDAGHWVLVAKYTDADGDSYDECSNILKVYPDTVDGSVDESVFENGSHLDDFGYDVC